MSAQRHPAATAPSIRAPRDDLCLDFANTLAWRGSAIPTEALGAFPDLLQWLTRAGLLPAHAAPVVTDWSHNHPKRAARLFAEAIAVREAIFRCGLVIASGEAIADADLAALNRELEAAPPRRRLVRDGLGYAWSAGTAAPSAAVLLAPILWSAADLIARADQLRVCCCANDKCLWLFIDRSKTGTRRWCDMAACGNRAKAQRHYWRGQPA